MQARFTELTSMDFFVKFRRWKAYQLLHTMTRGRAVGRVRKALSVSAFIVDPDLQLGLLDLGVICERMRGAVSHQPRTRTSHREPPLPPSPLTATLILTPALAPALPLALTSTSTSTPTGAVRCRRLCGQPFGCGVHRGAAGAAAARQAPPGGAAAAGAVRVRLTHLARSPAPG